MTGGTFQASDYQGTGPENYERHFVPTIGAPLAADLIEVASLRPGERVLDVACGTGVVTRLAARRVGSDGAVAGLDINPGMLAVARAATPTGVNIDWYEAGVEAMPLPDDGFDVVLCQMGLQFVPDKLQALQEIRRVLRPQGRVVLNLPGPTPELFGKLADALARHIGPDCVGFVQVVFSMHDGDEIRRLMSEAGFTDVRVDKKQKSLGLPPPEDFLWQYIHSTPLAGLVAKASDDQRAALATDVGQRWRARMADETLTMDVAVTTAEGSKRG